MLVLLACVAVPEWAVTPPSGPFAVRVLTETTCPSGSMDCGPFVDPRGRVELLFEVVDGHGHAVPLALDSEALQVTVHGAAQQVLRLESVSAEPPLVGLVVDPALLTEPVRAQIGELATADRPFRVRGVGWGDVPSVLAPDAATFAEALDTPAAAPDLHAAVGHMLDELSEGPDQPKLLLVVASGFYGEGTCGDEVSRLSSTLSRIESARERGVQVATIGVGVPYRPASITTAPPTTQSLCGPYADRPVADLRESGFDHLSLGWMALAGADRTWGVRERVGDTVREALRPRASVHRLVVAVPAEVRVPYPLEIEVRDLRATGVVTRVR